MSQNSKTAKMVLGRYYCVLNSRLALTRLVILNTWNKNTKTEVTSRNNVEHQSVPTPRILQWMPMPMVERHVQACLIFCLSFCLRVRALAWRHSDNKSVKRWNAAARLYSVAMGQIPRSTEHTYSSLLFCSCSWYKNIANTQYRHKHANIFITT